MSTRIGGQQKISSPKVAPSNLILHLLFVRFITTGFLLSSPDLLLPKGSSDLTSPSTSCPIWSPRVPAVSKLFIYLYIYFVSFPNVKLSLLISPAPLPLTSPPHSSLLTITVSKSNGYNSFTLDDYYYYLHNKILFRLREGKAGRTAAKWGA